MNLLVAQGSALQRFWMEAWNRLSGFLAPRGGGWLTRDIVPDIAWLQLFVCAASLLVTWGVVALLGHFARRKIVQKTREEAKDAAACRAAREAAARAQGPDGAAAVSPPQLSWMRLTLKRARQPFFAFLWVGGSYGALWVLLFRMPVAPAAVVALNWVARAALTVILFWFLYRMIDVVEAELRHWADHTRSKWDDILGRILVRALRLLAPFAAVLLILPTLKLPAAYHGFIQQLASLFLIGGVGFIICDLAGTAERAVIADFRTDVADNLAMRKIQTQVRMLKKIVVVLVAVVTVASMLMVFDAVRRLGTSLLASAGIAGVVVGFAAQKSLGTLIAGIQLAFTQPIRQDDVVIVDNEWGWIEEIRLTYVVVRIWDLRRLVVPITFFIEKPFQNWTRVSADLMGTVFLYLDYSVPIAALRSELDRILEATQRWDRKVKVIQVTDVTKDHTVEVRVLVSARDSGTLWDLRCEVREKLVDFLQREYPDALPRIRAELRPPFPHPTPREGNGRLAATDGPPRRS